MPLPGGDEEEGDEEGDSLVESVEEEVILEETKDGIRVKSMKQVHQVVG